MTDLLLTNLYKGNRQARELVIDKTSQRDLALNVHHIKSLNEKFTHSTVRNVREEGSILAERSVIAMLGDSFLNAGGS